MELHFGEVIYIFLLGILLFLVLKRQLFNPINKILDARESLIEDSREFVSEAGAEIEKKIADWKEKISAANAEAYEIQEKSRSDAYDGRKLQLRSAQEEAHKLLTDAREEIGSLYQKAAESLEIEAGSIAKEIVYSLTGRRV